MTSPELTCQEVVEIVNDYLDGALPAAQIARFEQHLGECEGCVTYLDQMRQTIGAVGRLEPDAVDPAMLSELVRAFRTWPG